MPREGVQWGRRRPQGNQAGDGLVKQVFELANEFCTRCNFGEFPGRMAVLAALVSELAARDARFHPSPRGLQDGGYRLPFPAWSGIRSLSPPPPTALTGHWAWGGGYFRWTPRGCTKGGFRPFSEEVSRVGWFQREHVGA